MIRLQKLLAEAGVASRRSGEKIILEGRVSVNGKPVREMGVKVDPAHDLVTLDGQKVHARRKLYVAVNKPPKCVTTRLDPQGRRTVSDLLPAEWAHLFPVGRLDYESEGLIFLTNDGDFCLKLTHPRYGMEKVYQATVEGAVESGVPPRAVRGVIEGGERLKAERVRILASNNTRSLLELVMREGKNREVRRLLGALGCTVERLVRIQIGRIKLGDLPVGRWRTLTESEIKSLLGNYENTTELPNKNRPDGRADVRRRQRGGGRG